MSENDENSNKKYDEGLPICLRNVIGLKVTLNENQLQRTQPGVVDVLGCFTWVLLAA